MPGIGDGGWLVQAYEDANEGRWETFTAHIAQDYVHRIPVLGIEWSGLDAALRGLQDLYGQLNLRQHARGVERWGDMLIAKIEMTSSLRPEPLSTVHVYRVSDDRLVECVAVTEPPRRPIA